MTICNKPDGYYFKFLDGILSIWETTDRINYRFDSEFAFVEGWYPVKPQPPETTVARILQIVQEKYLEIVEDYIETNNPTFH